MEPWIHQRPRYLLTVQPYRPDGPQTLLVQYRGVHRGILALEATPPVCAAFSSAATYAAADATAVVNTMTAVMLFQLPEIVFFFKGGGLT